MAFVLGLFDPGRSGSHTIVGEEINIPGIQNVFFNKVLTVNRYHTVVRNDERGNTAIKAKAFE